MDVKLGQIVGQKFRLESPLARGGMGSVWLGRHLLLDIPVAVKFMSTASESSPVARARFEREAKTAASLRSPHIVQVLDYGVDDDTPYIVMEFLVGEDLQARLRREGRLPLPVVADLVRQISKGIGVAHEAGVIHRDLKPSN